MENKKPEFAFTERPVISLVTEMRAYFQDLKSYYSITKGEIISRLDEVTEEAKITQLQDQLQEVNDKIASFSVLGDALSIADTILHTEGMIAELSSKKI